MKKAFLVLSLALSSGVLFAQSSDSENVSATAIIIQPLALLKVADLDFGTLISGSSAGTVEVAANGNISAAGGVTIYAEGHRASLEVTGEPGYTFSIDHPVSVTMANGSGGSLTASLNNDSNDSGTLDGLGAASFHIGGTLTVPAESASGTYVGEFAVTVAYP